VFADYAGFWEKFPVAFLLILILGFTVMTPFVNICIFIFFVITAGYMLIMPLNFYYANGQFFPHSLMDTLNKAFPSDKDTYTKKFLDLTYRVFILLSAIIFIYKSFKLRSAITKNTSAYISIFFTLLWLTFTWKDLISPDSGVPSAKAEPIYDDLEVKAGPEGKAGTEGKAGPEGKAGTEGINPMFANQAKANTTKADTTNANQANAKQGVINPMFANQANANTTNANQANANTTNATPITNDIDVRYASEESMNTNPLRTK
jgi:hypothetical protein